MTLNLGTQRKRGHIRRVGSSKSVLLMTTTHSRFVGCRRRKPRKTFSDEEVVGKLQCLIPNMQGSNIDACSRHFGEDGIAVVGDTGGHNVVGGLIKCNEAQMGCAAAEDGALTTGSEAILVAAREEAYEASELGKSLGLTAGENEAKITQKLLELEVVEVRCKPISS